MIEVFKTDVRDEDRAALLVEQIHHAFTHCSANFDLDDCDHILRVTGINCETDVYQIISLVAQFGHQAEILPDDNEPFHHEVTTGDGALINL